MEIWILLSGILETGVVVNVMTQLKFGLKIKSLEDLFELSLQGRGEVAIVQLLEHAWSLSMMEWSKVNRSAVVLDIMACRMIWSYILVWVIL